MGERLCSSLYRGEYVYGGSLRPLPSAYRPTILPPTPEPEAPPEEPQPGPEVQDQVDGGPVDGGTSTSEEDDPGDLAPKTADASPESAAAVAAATTAASDVSPGRSYEDGTLPDLVRSGRPLGRRRTLGHVSETVGSGGGGGGWGGGGGVRRP